MTVAQNFWRICKSILKAQYRAGRLAKASSGVPEERPVDPPRSSRGDLCHHCNGTGMRGIPGSNLTNTSAKCIACGGTGWWRK